MGPFIKRITVVGAAIAMLGGVACSSSSSSSSSAGSTAGGVSATEMDFSIDAVFEHRLRRPGHVQHHQ